MTTRSIESSSSWSAGASNSSAVRTRQGLSRDQLRSPNATDSWAMSMAPARAARPGARLAEAARVEQHAVADLDRRGRRGRRRARTAPGHQVWTGRPGQHDRGGGAHRLVDRRGGRHDPDLFPVARRLLVAGPPVVAASGWRSARRVDVVEDDQDRAARVDQRDPVDRRRSGRRRTGRSGPAPARSGSPRARATRRPRRPRPGATARAGQPRSRARGRRSAGWPGSRRSIPRLRSSPNTPGGATVDARARPVTLRRYSDDTRSGRPPAHVRCTALHGARKGWLRHVPCASCWHGRMRRPLGEQCQSREQGEQHEDRARSRRSSVTLAGGRGSSSRSRPTTGWSAGASAATAGCRAAVAGCGAATSRTR